ncbi:MAG: hypothetical protein FWG12_06070, partial [Holophagaceae bacterium]|nr:hypothetical protein [Holophagaceae bacterium]
QHNIVPIAYRPFDTRYTSYSGVTKGFHCMPRRDVMKHFLPEQNENLSQVGATADIQSSKHHVVPIAYRPFDIRFTRYSGVPNGFHCRPRRDVMKHFLAGQNVGLVIGRQAITDNWSHVQITNNITDNRIHYSNKGIPVSCPLYLYSDQNGGTREPNLNTDIVSKIVKTLSLEFEPEKTNGKTKFAPIDLLDYIYAVLHSPSYREKYKEFLKIDFPRVPYPTDVTEFRRLAKLGEELRLLHLMEHPALYKPITGYPISGNDMIDKLRWEPSKGSSIGKVWINDTQYFDKVPLIAWNFYIGGYQPAQKWLKDRKGCTLTYESINHYQQIIVALLKTDDVMQRIT